MTGVPRALAPFTPSAVDGVSIESEVRRGTAPQGSLLGRVLLRQGVRAPIRDHSASVPLRRPVQAVLTTNFD
jgi:hypothetical protein